LSRGLVRPVVGSVVRGALRVGTASAVEFVIVTLDADWAATLRTRDIESSSANLATRRRSTVSVSNTPAR